MQKNISLKSAVVLITIAILATSLIAYALYTFTITMHFKLAVAYGLEMWNEAQTEILTSIDYEEFEEGQTQIFKCYLKNVGNSPVDVYWEATIPPQWLYQMDCPSGWFMGEANFKTLQVGAGLLLQCQLTEVSAIVGVSYSMELAFSIVGS